MTIKLFSILQILLIFVLNVHHHGMTSAFVLPPSSRGGKTSERKLAILFMNNNDNDNEKRPLQRNINTVVERIESEENQIHHHIWKPQDLTADHPGFPSIPEDDYIKTYQQNPINLWPVEFFIIVYRKSRRHRRNKNKVVEILVRKSANGTSKYGLGTGVPITRWVNSSAEKPPFGYEFSIPRIYFDAQNYPEFPKNLKPEEESSWSYTKIDIRNDAFKNSRDDVVDDTSTTTSLNDRELEEYAVKIRDCLKSKLTDMEIEQLKMTGTLSSSSSLLWESKRISLIKEVVSKENCVAAIQGTLRMCGIFSRRKKNQADNDNIQETTTALTDSSERYVSLCGDDAPDPSKLVESMRIYTMFPQMPDPMPRPSTTPEELSQEIFNREYQMKKSGRNPHRDKYGRVYTHKSTSNVSNTIHGIYFTIDVTELLLPAGGDGEDDDDDDDIPPALDLFGTKEIQREWVSLEDLKVLAVDDDNDDDDDSPHSTTSSSDDGKIKSNNRIININTEDAKPIFISGFIVRQLVKEGVIDVS